MIRRKISTRSLFKQFKNRLDTYLVSGHSVKIDNWVGLHQGLNERLKDCSDRIYDEIQRMAIEAFESGWTIEEADIEFHFRIAKMLKNIIAFHTGLEAIYRTKEALKIVQHQVHIIMLSMIYQDAMKSLYRYNFNKPETNRLNMSKNVINHMLLNAQGLNKPRWLIFFEE